VSKPTDAQVLARAKATHAELVRATVRPPNRPVHWDELPARDRRAALSAARAELEAGH
jgi:hypothetical protein